MELWSRSLYHLVHKIEYGGQAHAAGIAAGDSILKVNDIDATKLTQTEILTLLKKAPRPVVNTKDTLFTFRLHIPL
jgi:C-terminal processing protease CtpA/Prc